MNKIAREKIVDFCAEYLKVKDFKDYCVNGLQVEGKAQVGKIVTGVSLSSRLIGTAAKKKAQMIIVHHGLFGDQIPQPPVIKGVVAGRLRLLLGEGINLCGFHLPLDAHPEIGNNISLCRLFGIGKTQPLDVGFVGELKEACPLNSWTVEVEQKLGTVCILIAGGKKKVKRVAVISGGSSGDYERAAELGADTFLCGDVRESVVRGVEERGLNLVNAGHYNTERLGVQNLGRLLARKFRISAEFVEVPCSI